MSSNLKYLVLVLLLVSCSSVRKLDNVVSGRVAMGLNVTDDSKPEEVVERTAVIDSIKGTLRDGPIIMKAIRDSETGEIVATDVINASKVTARFRNVAERQGFVTIEFDITVPREMADSRWQLKIYPFMTAGVRKHSLDPVFITGRDYRNGQLRGYERYRRFLNSIVKDSSDFVRIRQLEIFLQRHFPDTYAMKTDSSFISEPKEKDLFGVTQEEALNHYTRHLKLRLNERKIALKGKFFKKFVKDPIVSDGIRLDTVLVSGNEFVYRYLHTFRCYPKLRKVYISLGGTLYEAGEKKADIPFNDSLTYYISSLSTLVDHTPRYKMRVVERNVKDNTKAFVDFRSGSAVIDTTLGDNSSELLRIRKCIEDVVARNELCLDSLVITASCSPEGNYLVNRRLSKARAEMLCKYISDFVPTGWKGLMRTAELPEDWEQLVRLVQVDSLIDLSSKQDILSMVDNIEDEDEREAGFASMPYYRYMREKLYPQLRHVKFDFYLHRIGVQKDTVHTTEIDSVYMSGLDAMENLDYQKAVKILKPYGDYNAALALMSADYNHTAMDLLEKLDKDDARICYLKAIILARMEMLSEASVFLELSIAYDPYMEHRANLDPELHKLVELRNNNLNLNSYEK